jgi:hypothetical protein
MKNKILALTLLPLCASALFSVTACGGKAVGEKIDSNKTQIFVCNFKRGFGSKWIEGLKARFEEAHKDDTNWQEGRKGVQVIINNVPNSADSRKSSIKNGRDEIYFTEQSSYYQLQDFAGFNLLGDITDVVTTPLTEYGEERSIVDKLNLEQQKYYGVDQADGSVKYYGLPHYSGYFGLHYDVDLFEEKNFYFAETPLSSQLGDKFVTKTNTKRTVGPDGVRGTYDDGLPRTFAEFADLCNFMVMKNCTPFISTSANAHDYLNGLVNGIATNIDGREQSLIRYTGTGDAKNLATAASDGTLQMKATQTITPETGYEAFQSVGNYYGLKFLETILKNPDWYYSKLTDTSSFAASAAQDVFLRSRVSESGKPIGIISEGIWWESESEGTSTNISETFGEQFSKQNRKFAMMPFPFATEEQWEKASVKSTLYDHLSSLMFMKSTVAEWKLPLVKEFIRFAHTDESLREFTKTTNTPKALNYTMSETDKAEMTYYGRTLVELKEKSEIVYPTNDSSLYLNNSTKFSIYNILFTKVNGKLNQYAFEGLHTKKISAEDYFNGIASAFKDNWKTMIIE